MPDLAPFVILTLAGIATLAVAAWVVGVPDRSLPSCRSCGADARLHGWADAPRCSCGAALDRPNGVRVPQRRPKRLAVVGVFLFVTATVLGIWTARVHASGLGWRGQLPTWLLAGTLSYRIDEDRVDAQVGRRIVDGVSRDEARALLKATLDAVDERPSRSRASAQFLLDALSVLAAPEGELGRRCAAVSTEFLDAVVKTTPTGTSIELTAEGKFGESLAGRLIVRPDEVLIGGTAVPFRIVDASGAPTDQRWWAMRGATQRILIDSIQAAVASDVVVRGEATLYGPLSPHAASQLPVDFGDDPNGWGVPLARSRFQSTGVTEVGAGRSSWTTSGPASYGRWAYLLEPALDREQPERFVAVRLVVSALAGVLLAASFALLLLFVICCAPRRPRLVRPACASCGTIVRGAGDALPERCSECGKGLHAERRVVWIPRRVRPAPFLALSVVAIGGLSVLVAAYGPATLAQLDSVVRPRLATPEAYGQWSADECIGADYLTSSRMRLDWAWGTPPMPDGSGSEFAQMARRAAARRILSRWRDLPELHPHAPWHLGVGGIVDLARIVKSALAAGLIDQGEAQATIGAMIEETGAVQLTTPLCVRAGAPVTVADRGVSSGMTTMVRRIASESPPTNDWTLAKDLELTAPDHPGRMEVALEWAVVFPSMGEQWKSIPTDDVDRRLAVLPLRGEIHRTVVVLPNEPGELAITDERLNPLAPPTVIEVGVQPFGTRAEFSVNAWTYGLGVTLRGEWVMELPSGPLRLTSRIPNSSSWSALATMPNELPEEFTVRYVPLETDVAWEARRVKTPGIVWTFPTEVRVHRSTWTPSFEWSAPGRIRYVGSLPSTPARPAATGSGE